MKLYLVFGHDVEGFSQSLMVVAENPEAAIGLWNIGCLARFWPRTWHDDEALTIKNPKGVRELLRDVANTQYSGDPRVIDWDEVPVVFEGE